MEIIKQYSITKYAQYEEVESIGNCDGLSYEILPCYISKSGYVVSTETWLNEDTGEGWEIRKYKGN